MKGSTRPIGQQPTAKHRRRFALRQRGFTMVELMIVVAVLAISLTIAASSYSDVQNKRAVTNAAEAMAAFLRVARSEAVKRNEFVHVTLDPTSTIDGVNTFCGGVAETANCNCESGASYSCGLDKDNDGTLDFNPWLKGTDFPLIQAPTFSSGNSAVSFAFDPVRGILDPVGQGNVTMVSTNGRYAMRVSMTALGRVDICTVTGTLAGTTLARVGGYEICA